NLLIPAVLAVSVFAPAVAKLAEQLPAATVPVQLSPTPSLTVTLPVAVPLPGATAATAKLTVTACPKADGLGVCPLMVVVVLALFTVCVTPIEVLALKMLSPA